MDDRQEIGKRGEEVAKSYLADRDYEILHENYENDCGEIDIIVYEIHEEMVVFVEVRSGTSERFHAETSIGAEKRETLTAAGTRFLAKRSALGMPHRFDVVGVTFQDGSESEVRHHKNVFSHGL